MTSNADIVKALGELSSVVATGATRIDRLATATDEVADRVTRLEAVVEERTRDMVSISRLDAELANQRAECTSKRLDREREDTRSIRTKPTSYPPQNHSKLKTGGILGGALAALTAAGIGVYKLIEFLQTLAQ